MSFARNALILMLSALPVQAGTIYKYIDERGNTVYSDTPPPASSPRVSLEQEDLPPLLITAPVKSQQRFRNTSNAAPANGRSTPDRSTRSGYSEFGNSTRCSEYARKIAQLRRDLITEKFSRQHLLKQIEKFRALQREHRC